MPENTDRTPTSEPAPAADARRIHGTPPLRARWEPWMLEMLADPVGVHDLLAEHGSPVNVHDFAPLEGNARELIDAGAAHGVPVRVFVARKANKTLGLVDAVRELGHGIDVGSERELAQVLDRGTAPEDIILSAAVKPASLMRLAVGAGVPVSLDSRDEAELARAVSRERAASSGANPGAERTRPTPIVLRLAPSPSDLIAPTRFGESARTWLADLDAHPPREHGQEIIGVHFHLHGYAAENRTAALAEALDLVDALRERGEPVRFIDIGGGVPMRYLSEKHEWDAFWTQHREDIAAGRPTRTWRGDGLGIRREEGPDGPRAVGAPDMYPYWQELTRGPWLDRVLRGEVAPGVSAAEALRARGLVLHCEPGRSMLDGCGMTLARVAFRKRTSDGVPLVGLEMNRTQCRSTSADFLLDPALVPVAGSSGGTAEEEASGCEPLEGAFLVGAYCIEAELILRRAFDLPHGVRVGDAIALPNTGGYLMHILESASHQIPLAANVVRTAHGPRRDDIDIA